MAIVPYGTAADPVFTTTIGGSGATETTLQAVLAALGGSAGLKWWVYDQALAVASGVPTVVVSFTVPAGKKLILALVQAACQNRAEFIVAVDAATIAKRYTQPTILTTDFAFGAGLLGGIEIDAGSTVDVTVLHNQASAADMNATLFGELETA